MRLTEVTYTREKRHHINISKFNVVEMLKEDANGAVVATGNITALKGMMGNSVVLNIPPGTKTKKIVIRVRKVDEKESATVAITGINIK